jgi:hypothetical protein
MKRSGLLCTKIAELVWFQFEVKLLQIYVTVTIEIGEWNY